MLMVVTLLAISASASAFFNKSSNDLIAYCTVDDEKGGELVYRKFEKIKEEHDFTINQLAGHMRLSARFITRVSYLKDKKLTDIDVSVIDTRTQQSARAQGFSIPGSHVSASIDQGDKAAGASCGVIDEKFLEKHGEGVMVFQMLKHRIKNDK